MTSHLPSRVNALPRAGSLRRLFRFGANPARHRGGGGVACGMCNWGGGGAMIDGKCGILLDEYNKPRNSRQYFATLIGSYEICNGQSDYIEGTYPVPRSEFKAHSIGPKVLTDEESNDYEGELVRFELRGARTFGAKR